MAITKRMLACGLALLAGAATVRAQQPPGSSVLRVTLDFLAVTSGGQPILDLAPQDLEVKVGGQVARIRSLKALPAAREEPTRVSVRLSPRFGSPEAVDYERNFLVAVDDESLPHGTEQSTKNAIVQFIDRLSPRDRIGFLAIPHGGARESVTADHSRVARAVRQLSARGSRQESAGDAACRSRNVLRALMSAIETSAGDGPLTVIFVSGSMHGGMGDIRAPFGTAIACDLQLSEFEPIGIAAARARAYLYIVQPETFATQQWTSSARAGLEHLAGVTGGRLLQLSGQDDGLLDRVLSETSTMYVASVEVPAGERMTGIRDLNIKTSQRDTRIYARPSLALARGDVMVTTRTPPAVAAATLLAHRLPILDLPLRGMGYASRGTAGDVVISTLFGPADATASIESAAIAAYDRTGRQVARWQSTAAVDQRRLLLGTLQAAPDHYTLRVGVVATDGRRGTMEFDIEGQLGKAGPLEVSGILLGVSRANGFEPRLQFFDEPVATVRFELYGRLTDPDARVRLGIQVADTLDGPAYLSVPAMLSPTAEQDRFLASAALPIGNLPSGNFVVRVMVVAADDTATTATSQTLRKVQ